MTWKEVIWWSCRNQKKPFLADQLTLHSCREINVHTSSNVPPISWYEKDMLEDEDFVAESKRIIKMVKEAKTASAAMALIKTSVKNAVLRKMAKALCVKVIRYISQPVTVELTCIHRTQATPLLLSTLAGLRTN